MKRIITLIIMLCLITAGLYAQDVNGQLNSAKSAYGSGDLQSTRFELQQALNELDIAIGAEILKLLPVKMGDMTHQEADDNVTATTMGFTGVFVSRSYQFDETRHASLQIISDSPLLSGLNALIALPVFGADPNQKRVRISGYRGLLQKSEGSDGEVSWDLQLPVGSTLLTFNVVGVSDEKAVTDMASTIPVEQIARFAQ
jgi:hypothetical protein